VASNIEPDQHRQNGCNFYQSRSLLSCDRHGVSFVNCGYAIYKSNAQAGNRLLQIMELAGADNAA
jgi:hypothetical protein